MSRSSGLETTEPTTYDGPPLPILFDHLSAFPDEVYPPEGHGDPVARRGLPFTAVFWWWNADFGWSPFFIRQELDQHVFLKCHYCVVSLGLNFGSANHSPFWNKQRHQSLGPFPHFVLLQRHWNFQCQCRLDRFFLCTDGSVFFAVSEWTLFGIKGT